MLVVEGLCLLVSGVFRSIWGLVRWFSGWFIGFPTVSVISGRFGDFLVVCGDRRVVIVGLVGCYGDFRPFLLISAAVWWFSGLCTVQNGV